jgi:phosphoenolpyruvate carboxykinase (ATP)
MVSAAIRGELDQVSYDRIPYFNLEVPQTCPQVPSELLTPRETWKDKKAYDAAADQLAGRFRENFRQFEQYVDLKIKMVMSMPY